MSDALLAWTAVLLYIGLGVLVGLAARRQLGKGVSEFFLGNRQIGGFVAAMTYAATTYSAFMMLGLAGRRYNYLTHAELLADRYQNRAVGIVATLLCLIFLIPYAAIQVMGIGYLLASVSKGAIGLFPCMLLAMILAAVWAKLAGLRSVAWTDALQAIIMLLASLTALIFLVERGFGGVAPFFRRLNSEVPELLQGPGLFSFNLFLGLALPWLFFSLSNPQVTQRLFIPRSVAAFKQMIGGFLVFGFVYTLVAVLWGFGARLLIPGHGERSTDEHGGRRRAGACSAAHRLQTFGAMARRLGAGFLPGVVRRGEPRYPPAASQSRGIHRLLAERLAARRFPMNFRQ
jgi:SSS family solute:Na+ symporter